MTNLALVLRRHPALRWVPTRKAIIRHGRRHIGCASMVLLVLFVSFLLVVDIARIHSSRLAFRTGQVIAGLSDRVEAVVGGSGQKKDREDQRMMFFSFLRENVLPPAKTYCQARARLAKTTSDLPGHASTSRPSMQPDGKVKDACILPQLDPCDPQVLKFDKFVPKLNCSSEENWVYVKNGTFRISQSVQNKYGKILCEYAPIVRKGDYTATHARHIKPMLDGSPLLTDFFKAACISPLGRRYFNIHLGVAFKPELHIKGQHKALRPTAMGGYDVFIFGFDSVSRMSWLRNLPKTREVFLNMLGGIELEGHNILGDGTVQSLLPLLTGHTEQDLPSARRDDEGSQEVDNFPWIWKDFEKAGYVTAWGEDMSHVGTFQMRLNGFKDQPTDHYMRTYFLAAEPMYSRFVNGCVGSEFRHIRFFNYFRDMYHMYGDKRKFMFGFHSEFSHGNNNDLKVLDDDFASFLKNLSASGYLDHTVLILMADHGARFFKDRATQQGKLEERLPYFGFRFPPRFKAAYPKQFEQFRRNRNRLTTNFDVHETFHDLLDWRAERESRTKSRGVSLFRPIPESRSCEQAAVEAHWCACLRWENVTLNKWLRNATGEAVVKFLNGLTDVARNNCNVLTLGEVSSLTKFVPRQDVLKFKKSKDRHGDVPDLTDDMALNFQYLQVSLVTLPGEGRFEATVKHSLINGDFTIRAADVSRTNAYGNAADCVSRSFPNLRPYCYCNMKL